MHYYPPTLCHGQDWAGCRSETIAPSRPAGIPSSPSTEFCITVTDLNPSSSYIFRLYTIAPDGQEIGPGPEIAFDTEGTDAWSQYCTVCISQCGWNLLTRLVTLLQAPICSVTRISAVLPCGVRLICSTLYTTTACKICHDEQHHSTAREGNLSNEMSAAVLPFSKLNRGSRRLAKVFRPFLPIFLYPMVRQAIHGKWLAAI